MTDSTAYLQEGVAETYGVTVVPLHVVLGAWSGREGVEVSPADVAKALGERRVHVSTSRPTPAAFLQAYRSCGSREVVSVHLSAAMSGTADSARSAALMAREEGIEVRVVDSRSIAMGLGFAVLAAVAVAAAGGSLDEVEQAADSVSEETTTLFYVDTLEHLRRGGRVTAASALVGSALAVKPLLVVRDGEIGLLEKVRTTSKAVARLTELVVEAAGDGLVDVAVHHLAAGERAAALGEALGERLPGLQSLFVSEVGAVVGAHVGPGLLGVVVWRS